MMEKIPLGEAAVYLGVSRRKVWQMVKKDLIQVEKDPLDERKKLISLKELNRLKGVSQISGGNP
jgi:hypothetical protein